MSDFEVGDKVELIGYDKYDKQLSYSDKSSNDYLPLGTIGTIVDIYDDAYTLGIHWNGMHDLLYHKAKNVKLIKEDTMEDFKFEVGDEVSTPYGKGKIITLGNRSMSYFVRYNSGDKKWLRENDLELIKDTDTMEDFAIKVENEDHGKLIIGILEDNGLTVPYSEVKLSKYNEYEYNYIHTRYNHHKYDYIGFKIPKDLNVLENFTFQELVDALNGEYQWEDPIVIEGYEVEFGEDDIIIGCQEYSNSTVKQMYDLMESHNIKSFVITNEEILITRCKIKEIVDRINE